MADKPPAYNPEHAAMYPSPYPAGQYPPSGGQYPPSQPQGVYPPPATSSVTVVTVDQSGGAPVKWTWGNLVCAAISFFFCSCCGFPAIIIAILAYTDHKVKDFARSANKRKTARNLAITAFVCGILFFVIVIISNVMGSNRRY